MNRGKKIALVGAGAVALFGIFAYSKKVAFDEVITQMSLDVSNIRNLRTKSLKLYCDCDVTFKNNTSTSFEVSTAGLIAVKRITLLYKGKVLGNAYSNTTQFTLPANGEQKISNVQVELISLNIINQLFGGNLDGDPTNYTLEVEIVALGKTFIVEQ